MLLLDAVEVTRQFIKFLAASKLLYEGVGEWGKGGDGVVRKVHVPLESWTLEARAKAFAHTCFTLLPWYSGCEHALFVGHNMVCWISRAIVHLHIRERALLWHLNQGNGVYER